MLTDRSLITLAVLPKWAVWEDTRAITDSLDELGNTTAAMGKGFAIGAAQHGSVGHYRRIRRNGSRKSRR